jgi:hypothetical protein
MSMKSGYSKNLERFSYRTGISPSIYRRVLSIHKADSLRLTVLFATAAFPMIFNTGIYRSSVYRVHPVLIYSVTRGGISMDADYDIFEIVTVIRDFWLIDAESYQRNYCTNHGQALAPGYYVVNWPEQIRVRRFNEHAAFEGPFKLRKEAQEVLNRMYKERELVLTRSAEMSSTAALDVTPTNAKKADTQRLDRLPPQMPGKPIVA